MITVKGPGKDSKLVDWGRTILWEKHELHPKLNKEDEIGQVFVVNDGKEYQVGETAAVEELIHKKHLTRVNWNSRAEADDKPKVPANPEKK